MHSSSASVHSSASVVPMPSSTDMDPNASLVPPLDCIDFKTHLQPSLRSRIGRGLLIFSVCMIPLLYGLELFVFAVLFRTLRAQNNVQLEGYLPASFLGLLAVSLATSIILVAFEFHNARKIVAASSIAGAALNRLAYFYESARDTRIYAFLTKIRNPWKRPGDSIAFFIYYRLQDWHHVVAQTPRQWLYALFIWYFAMDGSNISGGQKDAPSADFGSGLKSASREFFTSATHLQQFVFISCLFLILIWLVQVVLLVLSMLVYPFTLAFVHMPSLRSFVISRIDERIETLLIDMEIQSTNRCRMKL
ncbi:hypothetical protein BC831DRAFT_549416 [Entophlyctis helioformis]|nr:hypothetical protein BC831DRAFT_549416 [Entophlyctis helioformis]